MNIVIIQYNAGNIASVDFALRRLGITATISNDAAIISGADKVIFPGVGEASSAMKYLKQHRLDEVIVGLNQPVLGICLGMQLMCQHSEEGNTDGIGIFSSRVKKFVPDVNRTEFKVPHMGWNTIHTVKDKLFKGIPADDYVYYVHSYYAEMGDHTIATTDYLVPFSAAMNSDNFYGTQFHPEKSGTAGEFIISNFLNL